MVPAAAMGHACLPCASQRARGPQAERSLQQNADQRWMQHACMHVQQGGGAVTACLRERAHKGAACLLAPSLLYRRSSSSAPSSSSSAAAPAARRRTPATETARLGHATMKSMHPTTVIGVCPPDTSLLLAVCPLKRLQLVAASLACPAGGCLSPFHSDPVGQPGGRMLHAPLRLPPAAAS